jgi:hypothetical protein
LNRSVHNAGKPRPLDSEFGDECHLGQEISPSAQRRDPFNGFQGFFRVMGLRKRHRYLANRIFRSVGSIRAGLVRDGRELPGDFKGRLGPIRLGKNRGDSGQPVGAVPGRSLGGKQGVLR